MSLFFDLDKKRMIFATPGKDATTVNRFVEHLKRQGGMPQQVRLVPGHLTLVACPPGGLAVEVADLDILGKSCHPVAQERAGPIVGEAANGAEKLFTAGSPGDGWRARLRIFRHPGGKCQGGIEGLGDLPETLRILPAPALNGGFGFRQVLAGTGLGLPAGTPRGRPRVGSFSSRGDHGTEEKNKETGQEQRNP